MVLLVLLHDFADFDLYNKRAPHPRFTANQPQTRKLSRAHLTHSHVSLRKSNERDPTWALCLG